MLVLRPTQDERLASLASDGNPAPDSEKTERALARGGWLGPPVEVCPETELIAIEASATVCDDAFQIGEGLEVLVGERLIQNRPEVLGRLKLGRVRGQVGEPEALRHDQVRLSVPAGAVEPEHDDAIPSRPGLTGKQGQEPCEERLGHPVRHVPEHLARRSRPKVSPEGGCTKAVTYNHL